AGLGGVGVGVGALDLDLAGRRDTASAAKRVDLVLLQEEVDALDVALDALVLELHELGEIELRRADADPHPAEAMAGVLEQMGRVQQRFGGDAADIEAVAAEGLFLLDPPRPQP